MPYGTNQETEEQARKNAEERGLKSYRDPGPCRYLCPGCGRSELSRDAAGYSSGTYRHQFNAEVCRQCVAALEHDSKDPFSLQRFIYSP